MSRLLEEVCFPTFTPSCFPSPREAHPKNKHVVFSVMWFVFHSSLFEGEWSGKIFTSTQSKLDLFRSTLLTKTGWLILREMIAFFVFCIIVKIW
jgi:hypothetical protein